MRKKNLYDLTDKEINKIEKEWEKSKWYERAVIDSKKERPNTGGYYACLIISIALSLISTIMFVHAVSLESDEGNSLIIEAVMFFVINIVFIIVVFSMEKDVKNKYIEEEKRKWLLEKYNIIK